MNQYSNEERKILLNVARESMAYGLQHHESLPIDLTKYPSSLQKNKACFVTLNLNHELRGCIGSLEAHQPLIQDISDNAFSAAFADPRFYPLTEEEFKQVEIHISVLSKPEPMPVVSEKDLLQQLRPGIDGLILNDGIHRATFLPAVWESLKNPKEFLTHLKMKAGLPVNYWSDSIRFERYTAESIE